VEKGYSKNHKQTGILTDVTLPITIRIMISEQDKAKIIDIGRQYNVREIYLFGSSIDPSRKTNDIDLAIAGIAPEEFFNFYGDLLFELSKPIDLIDLSSDTKFNRLIYRDGIRLYGQSA
jgi:predicted nucleotidyltransferase